MALSKGMYHAEAQLKGSSEVLCLARQGLSLVSPCSLLPFTPPTAHVLVLPGLPGVLGLGTAECIAGPQV